MKFLNTRHLLLKLIRCDCLEHLYLNWIYLQRRGLRFFCRVAVMLDGIQFFKTSSKVCFDDSTL